MKVTYLGCTVQVRRVFLNLFVRTLSGTVRGISQNNDLENREPTGDRFQNDPYREVVFSSCANSNSADPDQEETSHKTF